MIEKEKHWLHRAKGSSSFNLHSSFLQFLLHFNFSECLEHITFTNIIVVDERDTAVEVVTHFLHIILETLECVDVCCVNHNTIANDTNLVAAVNLSVGNERTGNLPTFVIW